LTDDNSNLVDIDLETFSKDFFNPTASDETVEENTEENNEEVNENEDDALATEENEDQTEDENSEENPDEDETEEDKKPKPKGKKSFQERINEVIAEARTAERERDALRLEIERLKNSRDEDKTETPAPKKQEVAKSEAPQPTDLDEDGEPKYKLGEFDPAFIRDLTKFTIDEERAKVKAEEEKTAQQKMVEAAQEELKSSWLEKVDEAEKEIPDLRDNLGKVGEAFAGIDPNYGEFLAATIMTCDFGPQIMYYLSQHIDEAQKIVASGPASATLAIGRLDAKFSKAPAEKRTSKQSSAPNPPARQTKGSGGGSKTVPGDTRDLAAFRREFYKK